MKNSLAILAITFTLGFPSEPNSAQTNTLLKNQTNGAANKVNEAGLPNARGAKLPREKKNVPVQQKKSTKPKANSVVPINKKT